MFQPTLGFNCGHASRAGRGDCLPEYGILDVTAGKHAGDIRARGIRLCLDITEAVAFDLAFENVGVLLVSDWHEHPVGPEFCRLLPLPIPELSSRNTGL